MISNKETKGIGNKRNEWKIDEGMLLAIYIPQRKKRNVRTNSKVALEDLHQQNLNFSSLLCFFKRWEGKKTRRWLYRGSFELMVLG